MNPQQLSAVLKAGHEAHRAGRLPEAERAYRQVLAHAPQTPLAMSLLGALLARTSRLDEAVTLLRRAAKISPHSPDIWQNLATALRSSKKLDEAIGAFEHLARLRPTDAWPHTEIGWSHESINRLTEARGSAERALEIEPAHPYASLLMAHLDRREGDTDRALSRLETLLPNLADPRLRAKALYLRATAMDAKGEYDRAFESAAEAADTLIRSDGFKSLDIRLYPNLVERYRAFYQTETGGATLTHAAPKDHHPELMFVVGFPRSGTTMVENILAAHPDISTSDEEPFFHDEVFGGVMRMAAQRAKATGGRAGGGGPTTFPECLPLLTDDDVRRLRAAYWKRVRHAAPGVGTGRNAGLFVDKVPFNLIHAGLIGRVFPDARMLVVIRDPRDSILSNVMQDYGLTQFTVDLITIERAADLYAKGMSLWLGLRGRVPQRTMQVRYEDIVVDFPARARDLIDFAGRPWHEDVLRFHEIAATRQVRTPSYEAITRPVNPSARGRWKRYERHLQPVQATLAPFVAEFGYEAAP